MVQAERAVLVNRILDIVAFGVVGGVVVAVLTILGAALVRLPIEAWQFMGGIFAGVGFLYLFIWSANRIIDRYS